MRYCVQCQKEYADELTICPDDNYPLINRQATTKADPFIGKIIMDKYRMDRLLGRGGMGGVYEGLDILLDRKVAIKVMNSHIVADETAVARFIREAKTCAKLNHANAVTIYDFGVFPDGGAFIVMEFIKGQCLRDFFTASGSLSPTQAIQWFLPVCAVIEAAHRQGIIHRDLKPENIMLKEGAEGITVKVVDFGLAKLNGAEGSLAAKLSKTGDIMGTPHYMAPELFDGEAANEKADIYALGIIFYEMITGTLPFDGTMQNIISGHLLKAPKPVTQINPQLDPKIDEVLQLALNKQREERIGSALEFGEALRAVIMGSTSGVVTAPSLTPVATAGSLRSSGQVLATLADTNSQISSSKHPTLIAAPSAMVAASTAVVPPAIAPAGRVTEKMNAQLATEVFNASSSALAADPDANITFDESVKRTQKVANSVPETMRIPISPTSSSSTTVGAPPSQRGKLLVVGGMISLVALVGAYKGLVASSAPPSPTSTEITQPKEPSKPVEVKKPQVIQAAEADPATPTPEGGTPSPIPADSNNHTETTTSKPPVTGTKDYKPPRSESKTVSAQQRSEAAYNANRRRQENDDSAGRAIKNVGGAIVHGVTGLFRSDKKDKKDKRHEKHD